MRSAPFGRRFPPGKRLQNQSPAHDTNCTSALVAEEPEVEQETEFLIDSTSVLDPSVFVAAIRSVRSVLRH